MKSVTVICKDGNKETYPFKSLTIDEDGVIEIKENDHKTIFIDNEDAADMGFTIEEVLIKL